MIINYYTHSVHIYTKNIQCNIKIMNNKIKCYLSKITYTVCPESKCTDFLFKYLLDLPEITSDLLQSMTLGKIHSGSNVSSTVHSSTGSHFP